MFNTCKLYQKKEFLDNHYFKISRLIKSIHILNEIQNTSACIKLCLQKVPLMSEFTATPATAIAIATHDGVTTRGINKGSLRRLVYLLLTLLQDLQNPLNTK